MEKETSKNADARRTILLLSKSAPVFGTRGPGPAQALAPRRGERAAGAGPLLLENGFALQANRVPLQRLGAANGEGLMGRSRRRRWRAHGVADGVLARALLQPSPPHSGIAEQ